MARLIIYEEINGADTVYETYYLQENRVIIGSDDDNQLILESPDVEPMHASLELRENHHWYLQDLGGMGGTGVNGQLIAGPYMLRHNDVIEVGFVKMRFQVDDERGVTEEYVADNPAHAEAAPEAYTETARSPQQPSGRIWFAGLAFATAVVIFLILLVFFAGHILGLINMMDLLPGS
ncbi:MAG: hypothetical protein Kow0031_21810 [Anaerolineae bacterium]